MAVFATAIDATSSGSLIRGPLLFLRFKLENTGNLTSWRLSDSGKALNTLEVSSLLMSGNPLSNLRDV